MRTLITAMLLDHAFALLVVLHRMFATITLFCTISILQVALLAVAHAAYLLPIMLSAPHFADTVFACTPSITLQVVPLAQLEEETLVW